MTGEILKQRLLKRYKVLADVAKKLGVSPQSLNQTLAAVDIKTGFIEKLASVYNVSPAVFFDDDVIKVISTEGDYSPASDSGDVSVVVGDAVLVERIKLLEKLIEEKDERIGELKERIEELKGR
ncbi:MAG: helix-turn-helix transcriptional regulator [Bacteroidales bacterium]|nr:helix-turn-helix transcriptional regulator [Bacteroidales bacterium]